MTTIAAPKKTYEVVALVLLLPALYIQLYLLSNSFTSRGEAEIVPGMMLHVKVVALISLVCAVSAVILGSKSFNQKKVMWRVASFITVLLGSLIALISLVQLV